MIKNAKFVELPVARTAFCGRMRIKSTENWSTFSRRDEPDWAPRFPLLRERKQASRILDYCSGCGTACSGGATARGGYSISSVDAAPEFCSICTATDSVPADSPRSTPRVGAASP
jgi:hypothetical protein